MALLAVAACVALILVVPRVVRPAAPVPSPLPDTTVKLFTAREDEIAHFTIHPPGEEAYTITRTDGAYQVAEQPDFVLNHASIRAMLDALIYFEAADTVGDTQEDGLHPEDFGLSEEALHVSLTLTDGRTFGFRIGHRMATDIPLDYGLVDNDPKIYAFNIDLKDTFDQRLRWLHTIPQVNFTPELLDSLHFTGDQKLLIRRLTDGLWVMDQPYEYPVSAEKMRQVFDAIKKMRFASYISPADEDNLARYGLAQPRSVVTFHLAPSVITAQNAGSDEATVQPVDAQSIRIEVGDTIPGLGFYCRYGDTIYQASDLSMGFVEEADPSAYLSGLPLYVPLNGLSQVALSADSGMQQTYQIALVEDILPNNEIARDAQGNTLYRYLVSADGKEQEAEPFVKAYASLMGIRASGSLAEGYQLPEHIPPLLSVRLLGNKLDRVVAFSPYDTLHAAISVNGQLLHYTDLASVANVVAQFAELAD